MCKNFSFFVFLLTDLLFIRSFLLPDRAPGEGRDGDNIKLANPSDCVLLWWSHLENPFAWFSQESFRLLLTNWEHRVLTTGPPGKFLLLFNHCCVWLFETPWTTAFQASLSSRLLCPWNLPGKNTAVGKPFPSPRDLPDLGIEPRSPAWQTDSWPSEPTEKPREVPSSLY